VPLPAQAQESGLTCERTQDDYRAQGAIVEWMTAEEIAARIVRDIARWRALAEEAPIRAE
jgi:tripartite-type tricarboxylate transporter receptor subunit TctC